MSVLLIIVNIDVVAHVLLLCLQSRHVTACLHWGNIEGYFSLSYYKK